MGYLQLLWDKLKETIMPASDLHDELHPYATTIPGPALIGIVMDALKYRQVDIKLTVHASYHLVSYGLGKWDAHELMGSAAAPQAPLNPEDAADLLAPLTAKEASTEARTEMGAALPWGLLIPILTELIRRLLNG